MTTHWPRLLVPVLAAGLIVGAGIAWLHEADAGAPDGAAEGPPPVSTPILSVRRAPELVASPIANRQLLAQLGALTDRLPEDSCLAVAGPELSFLHRADVPTVPASALKLLTATAALEVLGREPPVLERVAKLLRDSDNPTAEALLEEIGGTTVVGEVLADLGTPRVVDGTGLSHENRVTCRLLVDLLLRPTTGELLGERLPVAGESGTLTTRFVDPDLVGVLRAKTGSLTSVVALTGVVEDEDPPLTFALMVNTEPGTPVPMEIEGLQREVAEALARWPAVPNLAELGPKDVDG